MGSICTLQSQEPEIILDKPKKAELIDQFNCSYQDCNQNSDQFYTHDCGAKYHVSKQQQQEQSCLQMQYLIADNKCQECQQQFDNSIYRLYIQDHSQQFVPPTKYKCNYYGACYKELQKNELFDPCYVDSENQGCGHEFCLDCIRGHIQPILQQNLQNRNFDMKIKCQGIFIDHEFIEKCDHFINITFIQQQFPKEYDIIISNTQYNCQCPYKECLDCIFMEEGIDNNFKCPRCQQRICFKCKQKEHQNIECQEQNIKQFIEYLEQTKEDYEEGVKFRIAFCPKCIKPYVKNKECEHVKCVYCQEEFCFSCSAPREPSVKHDDLRYHRLECKIRQINKLTKFEMDLDVKKVNDCQKCQQTEGDQPCKFPETHHEFIEKICQRFNIGNNTSSDRTIRDKICLEIVDPNIELNRDKDE